MNRNTILIGINNPVFPDTCRVVFKQLKGIGKNAYRFINAVSDFATHAEPLRKTANYRENLFAKTMEGNPVIDKAYRMVCAA